MDRAAMTSSLLDRFFPKSSTTIDDGTPKRWFINTKINESSPANTVGLSNAISTTKYSLISWLPKSLFEQFRRIANAYFLLISILMLIGTYATYIFQSPLDPYSTVMTLLFVLLVTSFKEGSEDYQRYKSDKDENEREYTVITFDENNRMIENKVQNQKIKSGDIIKMTGRTLIPADMLLIATSNWADGNQCYVETTNIDGETNLKVKEAPTPIKSLIKNGEIIPGLFKGELEVELPQKNIYTFLGAFKSNAIKEPIPLGIENLLVRACVLSNTEWAYGIAVYTGSESKIQLNSMDAPSKMSQLEGYLNKAILIIFAIQAVLVSVSVISIYILGYQDYKQLTYVFPPGETSRESVLPLWLEQWFVFFLLYNNLIPISLYVTIELVNLGQGFLISSDQNIYDEELDCATAVRSSNLCQELGMVSNVFSDKTGTLTRNVMKLVKYIVEGQTYEIPVTGNADITPVMNQMKKSGHKDTKLYRFLRCLTTCHTVVREKDGTYRAESPDELALVEAVDIYGCKLKERGTVLMTVEMLNIPASYEILAVNAFNSDRKRMSVVVRDTATNEYYIMCKGADNIMLPLTNISATERKGIDKSLLDLACQGLRTLCIAEKKLSAGDAQKWLSSYRQAAASMQNRSEKLFALAAELEQNMDLLGITAIEDRLQDEVPEVIAELAKAKIIVWMLTGDKEETAISIGRSCNLLLNDTKIFSLTNLKTTEDYSAKLTRIYDDITANYVDGGYRDEGKIAEVAIVMDGPSFSNFANDDKKQRKMFLDIGKRCRSVIACRLTPSQKQQVVNIVKTDPDSKSITCSIGDGANDVSMIREANVGVGIYGKEGRQAANNADVAIGQFKFLRRLLLVHGRWNYIRQSRVFLYCMHKNMVITLTLFWYSYFSFVSGTSTYESWIYSSFNLVLGLPIIFYGIQDRDLSEEFCLKYPQTYSTGRDNSYLNIPYIASWIFNGVLYAIILCLLFYYTCQLTFIDWSVYEFGTTVFTGLVMALQLKIIFMNHQYDKYRVFMMFFSIGGMLAWYAILSGSQYDFYYVSTQLFYDLKLFWFFGFFSAPLFTCMIDYVEYYIRYFFFPTNEMLYREAENIELVKNDCLVQNSLKKEISSTHSSVDAKSRQRSSEVELGYTLPHAKQNSANI